MIIKRITINNFQSYYGEQTIEFSKGLNLVIGKGGKGKSKLFNAFYWVLFGKIYITDVGWCDTDGLPQSSKGAMYRQEFINMKALCDTPIGKSVSAGVILVIEDDHNDEYIIERSVEAIRKNGENWKDNLCWDVRPNNLKVSFDSVTGTQVKVTYQAEDIIRRLFPPEIRNYIWFQGESLESLIDFRKKETLEAAVQHISYFPYYQKLSEIISKSKVKIERMEDKVIREANKNNAEANALLSKKKFLNDLLEKEKDKLAKKQEEIEAVKQAISDEELKLKGLANYTGLVQKYDECEGKIRRLNDEISQADQYEKKQLPYLWILNGSTPLLEKSKELIRNYTQEEYAAPEKKYLDNPSRSKLEEIIRDHQCYVCGARVEEGNERYEWIMHRIKEQEAFLREMEEYRKNADVAAKFNMFIGRIQDYPDEIMNALNLIEDQFQEAENTIEDRRAQRKKLLEEKFEYDEKIQEIKRRHNIDPRKQASSANLISSNMDASRSHLSKLEGEERLLQASVKEYRSKYDNLSKKAEELGVGTPGVVRHEETEWKHISSFLDDICKKVQEKARQDLLVKIEKRANKFYSKFTEHDTGYRGNVKIDQDYTIEFDSGLNTSHEDRKKMSIINALLSLNQEAMGIYYPFISDAPTSNFDPETTHKYLLGIKDIFGQTIIMTKDVEIDGEAYNDLLSQHNVSKIYELQSQLYCDGDKDPDLNEVSTIVDPKK